jgi:deoxycytidine triphosphate deaminase
MRHKRGWAAIISPDVRIKSIGPWGGKLKQSHTLKPGELAVATVQQSFKTHPGHIPDISTRSVVARHGVDVSFSQGQVKEILTKSRTPRKVTLLHSGGIPLKLRRGNRLHRVYFPQLCETVPLGEVRRLRKSGGLVLGKDMKLLPSGMIEIKIRPVVYKIDPKKHPHVHKQNWVSGSKRHTFMGHFKKVHQDERTTFRRIFLTETEPVKFPKGIGMTFLNTTDGNSVHIKSLFIDPGFEGPIVMEILGLRSGKKPDTVIARLVRPRKDLVGE